MNIDQQIYGALLNNAGGNQSKIKGLSQMTIIQMKKGKSRTTFSKLFEVLIENGINKISLYSNDTQMDFDAVEKDVIVTTKSLR